MILIKWHNLFFLGNCSDILVTLATIMLVLPFELVASDHTMQRTKIETSSHTMQTPLSHTMQILLSRGKSTTQSHTVPTTHIFYKKPNSGFLKRYNVSNSHRNKMDESLMDEHLDYRADGLVLQKSTCSTITSNMETALQPVSDSINQTIKLPRTLLNRHIENRTDKWQLIYEEKSHLLFSTWMMSGISNLHDKKLKRKWDQWHSKTGIILPTVYFFQYIKLCNFYAIIEYGKTFFYNKSWMKTFDKYFALNP